MSEIYYKVRTIYWFYVFTTQYILSKMSLILAIPMMSCCFFFFSFDRCNSKRYFLCLCYKLLQKHLVQCNIHSLFYAKFLIFQATKSFFSFYRDTADDCSCYTKAVLLLDVVENHRCFLSNRKMGVQFHLRERV